MTTIDRLTSGAGARLVGCVLILLTIACTTPATAQRNVQSATDPSALAEVLAPTSLPGRMSKGHFDDNPGCVRAKLDIWLARGRHTHQVFPLPAQPAAAPRSDGTSGTANSPIDTIMDADGATIFVGHEGCRIRIRIDRAE